tara:strand:- start:1489 stop:1833 length:345 start_codon:yes stop_codon:yes gene_type:complete
MTSEEISFNDWSKIDLRVGKVLEVENIENADKLYKFTVDLGKDIGKKTICSGMKEHYSKEELKGKKVIVFINLQPRKFRGVLSEGMILAACTEDESKVILITPEKDIEVGNRAY